MKEKTGLFVLLNFMLMIYSASGIFSKLAAKEKFLSFRFIFFYGILILILAVYAVAWQQIIKRLPLTTAYANRAVTVAWGAIWGVLFFHEKITLIRLLGIAIVVFGVVLFAISDREKDEGNGGNE